jgi:hypothetical protein
MNRKEIRELKRAVSKHTSREAMQELLQRSVRFGHKRLALLRCLQAEKMGVPIAPETLAYCQQVADRMPSQSLEQLVSQAMASLYGDMSKKKNS